jgi:hypothetical protein
MGMEGANGATTHGEAMQGACELKNQANTSITRGGGCAVSCAPKMGQGLPAGWRKQVTGVLRWAARMQMGQMRRPERITSGTAQDKENARQMSYFGGVVKKTRVTNMEGGLESFVKI